MPTFRNSRIAEIVAEHRSIVQDDKVALTSKMENNGLTSGSNGLMRPTNLSVYVPGDSRNVVLRVCDRSFMNLKIG